MHLEYLDQIIRYLTMLFLELPVMVIAILPTGHFIIQLVFGYLAMVLVRESIITLYTLLETP